MSGLENNKENSKVRESSYISKIKLEIESENSSSDTNINNVSCSYEEDFDESTNDKGAEGSDQTLLTKSQLRRLRRGPKLKRSGKKRPRVRIKNKTLPLKENTLLLGNLPPSWNIEAVESLLKQVTGFTKDNSSFYIEMLRLPGQHFVEALILFLEDEHLLSAFRTLHAVPYSKELRFTVKIQNRNTPGYRIPNDFQRRFWQHMASLNLVQINTNMEATLTDNTEENRNTSNAIETTNKPANEQQREDKQTHLTENNPEDIVQGKCLNIARPCDYTIKLKNKNSNESPKDDVCKECLAELPPPPIVGTKSNQIDLHEGDSNDSTETFILKQEPIDFNEMASVAPELVGSKDQLPVKQEPLDIRKDISNISLAPAHIKREPKYLHDSQTQVTQNDEIKIAIDHILNNFDPSQMQIKHEIIDNQDDNQIIIDLTKNNASITASNEILGNSEQSGEFNDENKTPRHDKDEITCETAETADQAVRPSVCQAEAVVNKEIKEKGKKKHKQKKHKNKDASSEKDYSKKAPSPSNHTSQVNETTQSNHIVTKEASSENSPARSNDRNESTIHDESDAENCKIVHIKNLPITTQNHLINLIKYELMKRMFNTVNDDNLAIFIHIPHNKNKIGHKILGEALIKFNTHEQALLACKVLNGINVAQKVIDVNLDVGHKIVKENMKFIDLQLFKFPPRKRTRSNNDQNEDVLPPAKQLKIMETELLRMQFTKQFLPPAERIMDIYGLSPKFLSKLGLRPPLSNTVIVKQLHELVDEDKLREVFSMAGDIKKIQFFKEKKKARIDYDHPVEAVQAIQMFRKQKLFGNNIIIHMDCIGNPRPLPFGLSGVNKGLERNGEPLKGVRTYIELNNIKDILYELGKMVKFEYNNSGTDFAPFNNWYEKRMNNECSIQNRPWNIFNTPNFSVTPDVISPSVMSSVANHHHQSTTDFDTIEALGTVLKARGLIPGDTHCIDAKNILAALQSQSNDHNDPLNRLYSPISNTSPLNYMLPNANVTSSFTQSTSTHAKAPQNFAQGVQNPILIPNQPISPNIVIPSLNWEQVSNIMHPAHLAQTNSNYRNDDREKRREDYPRDPRVANKGRDSNASDRKNRVIFKNLPPSLTQAALTSKMREVGKVLYCEVTGVGSAIVAFKNFQDAERCFRLFNRSKFDGQLIEVICV